MYCYLQSAICNKEYDIKLQYIYSPPHWYFVPLTGESILVERRAKRKGKSLVEHLVALPSKPETTKSSSSSIVKPTWQTPSLTAIVAGMAPFDRMIFDISFDSCLFSGYGSPWLVLG